jgi:hypothetical protein
MAAAVERTRALFKNGAPLCGRLRGRLGYEIRVTWLAGTRILDRLETMRFDILGRRPTIGAADVPWLAATALAGPKFIQKRAAET